MRNIRLLTVIAAAAMGLSACSGTGVKTADQTAGNAAAQETEAKETADASADAENEKTTETAADRTTVTVKTLNANKEEIDLIKQYFL